MSDSGLEVTALLEANAEFYRAFRTGDLDAMTALWADDDDILCVHPGHATLRGRSAILQSWFDILNAAPSITMEDADARIRDRIGLVTCVERLGEARLAATNIFRMHEGEWRMIHHHGSQIFTSHEDEAPDEALVH